MRTVCHKYDIRHEVDTPTANHFNLLEGNFEIIPIEQPPIVGSKTETDLLRLERTRGFLDSYVANKKAIWN